MAVHYDFIVYSIRTSATSWAIGMKAIQGEVPLDVVIPDEQGASDADESPEVVSVLTPEGLERESSDGLELYHYLRRLNPKKNEAFNYNEVVIRNIHSRLNTLQINQELRVQIAYTERQEPYARFSYQIKLLGVFGKAAVDSPDTNESEITVQPSTDTRQHLLEQKSSGAVPNQQVYRTTNTIEKLISFTQNLQKELNETQKHLGIVVNKVQQLDDDNQRFREIHTLIEDLQGQIRRLSGLDTRIQYLEADRQELQDLQQTLQKFLIALNQMTRVSLREYDEDPVNDR